MTKANKKMGKKVVKPGKELISSKAISLRKKLIKIIDQDVGELIIDFSGVNKVDPAGISTIIAASNALNKNNGKLKLKNVPEEFCNLFQTMNLEQHFEINAH